MGNVVFLLGAGVSIPAGMPSTAEITECVKSGERVVDKVKERVVPTGMGSYRFSAWPTVHRLSDEYIYVSTIIRLFCILRQALLNLIGDEQDHYEALFYALRAAIDGKEARRTDPGAICFWRRISADIESLPIASENLLPFLYDAEAYIRHVVCGMLVREPSRLDNMNCLIDGCRDQDTSSMTIATLNHDTVIEQALRRNGFDYVDGFGSPDNVERHWSPSSFDKPYNKIVLLKLHGSVDLFEYQDQNKKRNIVARSALRTVPQLKEHRPYPWLLIGTYNKQLDYSQGPFLYLHYRFAAALQSSDRLIVAGYGWGDDGINAHVFSWMDANENSRIVNIDPHFNKTKQITRSGAAIDFRCWGNAKRLQVIEKCIQKVSWTEIKHELQQ